MSHENVDLTYRIIDAFNRRDLGDYLALNDPAVEFLPYEVQVQGGDPYRGHAGVRSWWEDSFAALPDLRSEKIYEVRDLGDRTLLHQRIRGQGAASGAPIERTGWQLIEWRDNKVIWWGSFENEAEALQAAALPE